MFKIAKYCIRYSVSVKLFDDNIICWGRYWTSTGQQQFHECGRVTNMADIDLSYTKNGSHCELCDVSFTSMSHCRQHCDGRKHKNKLCDRRIAGKSKRLISVRTCFRSYFARAYSQVQRVCLVYVISFQQRSGQRIANHCENPQRSDKPCITGKFLHCFR